MFISIVFIGYWSLLTTTLLEWLISQIAMHTWL